MYLSSLKNLGIFEKLDKRCGTTIKTYPLQEKLSDINEALEWYCSLAFKADKKWNFDDLSESSPPIDNQNIVSGTNRYKLSSFTEKIYKLIKLEILDSNGNGLNLIPETLQTLGSPIFGNQSGVIGSVETPNFQELYLNTSRTGTPTHYIKYGDFIYLRPFPNYNSTNGLKAYFNRPATSLNFVACQAEADDEKITAVGHGLVANDTVIFEVDTNGTIPGGITADQTYYVISTGLTADVFEVSATRGGSAVNITTDGTNCYFLKTNAEPGIASLHHNMLVRKAALTRLSEIDSNKVGSLLNEVMKDEMDIQEYYSERDKDVVSNFTPVYQNNK